MSSSSSSALPGRLRAWLGAVLLAASGVSQAGVSLSWDLAAWQYDATPSQTLELRATVYNEASATEHLLGSRFWSHSAYPSHSATSLTDGCRRQARRSRKQTTLNNTYIRYFTDLQEMLRVKEPGTNTITTTKY